MESSTRVEFEVFKPIKLQRVDIPNRIIFPAMELNLATLDGKPTRLYLEVYAKPARGGAGLVFGGSGYPHISGRGSPYMLSLDRDYIVSELSKVSKAILECQSIPAIQILHVGRYTSKFLTEGRGPVAPSPIPPPILFRETPRELSIREIEELVEAYGRAAYRAVKAGFKIVEIHAGMGYLISEFLSKRTNKRRDSYGGSLENRARFLLEVVEECIRKCKAPVIVRYSLLDFLGEGVPFEENLKVIKWLEDLGIACLNAVFGWHESRTPLTTRDVAPARFAKYTGILKKSLGIPVAYGTRVKSLEIGEKLIRGGLADMICLGRPLLADPEAPIKTLKNIPVRPCIACNRCLSQVFSGRIVSCTVNPSLLKRVQTLKSGEKREVVVVGGGPSGLEAALTLSEMGAHVELYEEEDSLGGMLKYASLTPYGVEFRELIDYYVESIERKGVIIHLNSKVKVPSRILEFAEDYDLVVLALGPKLDLSWVRGERSKVKSWKEGFNLSPRNRRVAILGGNQVGLGLGEYLADRGCEVYVLDVEKIGVGIEKAAKWPIIQRLKEAGVQFYSEIVEIRVLNGKTLEFQVRGDGKTMLTVDYVFATRNFKPRSELSQMKKLKNIVVVGNALKAPLNQMLYQAIHSSHNIVSSI